MLQWILERLLLCQKAHRVILATTILEQDQPLVELALKLAIPVFRGSESDVLDRYYHCAVEYGLTHIIRATGDNPFVEPKECDRLVDFYFERQLDYATVSTVPPDGYPCGVGVEILSFKALEKSWHDAHAPHHREHVNEYILENPALFRQATMPAPQEMRAPDLSLTVDTLAQFLAAETLYSTYRKQYPSNVISVIWVIDYVKKTRGHFLFPNTGE